MTNIEKEPSHDLRGKTDKSLEDERLKTDEYLDQKSNRVSNEAQADIRLSRFEADEKREITRTQTDLEKAENRLASTDTESTRLEDKILSDERERCDKAQNAEREKEDRVRAKERFQKRLIAEALLENERRETDTNLIDERTRFDLESEQNSTLLLDEKISHDLTKTALVTRDQFVAVVSHDLKNPLSSIAMSAALMRTDLLCREGDRTNLFRYLDIIERNAANMDRMISDLLDVERMANAKLTLKLEREDLRPLLQECKDLFAPAIASK